MLAAYAELVGIDLHLARDDNADDRDTDETGDACDRIVDRRSDASITFVGVGENGRDEQGDGERQSECEHEQRRQQIREAAKADRMSAKREIHLAKSTNRPTMDTRGNRTEGGRDA